MKTPGYMVALTFKVPELGLIEKFERPYFSVYGPVEFLFPPDKWMTVQRESDNNFVSLQMFAKDERQVEQAKQLLVKELNKTIKKWTTKLEEWEMDFENSLREK